MTKPMDLTGQTFHKWTVLSFSRKLESNKRMWLCRCECGLEKEVEGHNLVVGRSRACRPCSAQQFVAPLTRKHGLTKNVVYKRWQAMKTRCTNPNTKDWHLYGGRGVTVAPEWMNDFMAFYAHIGDPPTPKHTVDRKDPWGNYEPGNVKWATQTEQANNTRRSQKYAERREAEQQERRAKGKG